MPWGAFCMHRKIIQRLKSFLQFVDVFLRWICKFPVNTIKLQKISKPKKFLWSRRLQFWKTCGTIFAQGPKEISNVYNFSIFCPNFSLRTRSAVFKNLTRNFRSSAKSVKSFYSFENFTPDTWNAVLITLQEIVCSTIEILFLKNFKNSWISQHFFVPKRFRGYVKDG